MPPRKRTVASRGSKLTAATTGMSKGDYNKADALFNAYREEHEDLIGPEGIIQLCKDLGVDPSDRKALLLAWKMGAQRQGFFSREEFRTGFSSLGVTTLEALKEALPSLDAEIRDPIRFQQFYGYAFDFCLMEPGQKIVDVDTAADMLAIVLPDGRFTSSFCDFLREQAEYKKVNRDQWNLFLRFSREVRSDLSNHDENPSWPVLLDNFVDWSRGQARAAPAKAPLLEADQPRTTWEGKGAAPMPPKSTSPPVAQKGRGRKRSHGH